MTKRKFKENNTEKVVNSKKIRGKCDKVKLIFKEKRNFGGKT